MNATVSIPVTRPSAGRSIERGTDAGLERPLPVDRNRTNRDRLVDEDRRCPLVAAVVVWDGRTEPPIGVGVQGLGVSALPLGFVGYAVVGEYERLRLRESFSDRTGARPSSPIE
ncbi:hypothetical protein [Haloterrigena salinisoli]|uniref:hypothetical protein n=1 Tax=Haloterrigena salinisoli TaxID=3132747 RepID=UPI0030D0AA6D